MTVRSSMMKSMTNNNNNNKLIDPVKSKAKKKLHAQGSSKFNEMENV